MDVCSELASNYDISLTDAQTAQQALQALVRASWATAHLALPCKLQCSDAITMMTCSHC